MAARSFLIVALVACSSQQVGVIQPGPRGANPWRLGGMPVPPVQDAGWTAPAADVPAALISATTTLFDQGLADPRGGAYREVELVVGDVWGGGGQAVATHAWTFTDRVGAVFAVAWNGLVYRVASVGADVDLATDVDAVVAGVDADVADQRARWGRGRYHRFAPIDESYGVSATSPTGLKAALLLRLGEGALAARAWAAYARDPELREERDPYRQLAQEWVWWGFDRALTAHMRGDDAYALAVARPVPAVAQLVEAECDRRGFARRDLGDGRREAYLDIVEPLPVLVAELERRATVAARPPLLAAGELARLADADRVAYLIDRLDDVAARQWGQPGGVNLADDPIVAGLIAIGPPAVEPLIAALETDPRITRSVHFHRDFHYSRSLLSVAEAAYVALAGILETNFFAAGSTGDDLTGHGAAGQREVAARVRAFWATWKGVAREERWYRMLADDRAPAADWADAAQRIAQPTNVSVSPSSMMFVTTMTTEPGPGETVGMRGEVLRAHAAPSVTELMIHRVDDVARAGGHVDAGCAIASALADWDPAGARGVLGPQVARAIAGGTDLTRWIVDLTLARAELADPDALADYGGWIRAVDPDATWVSLDDAFAPMRTYPTDPAVIATAEAMFGPGSTSAWLPIVPHAGADHSAARIDLIGSDLLRVAPFNAHVVAALADTHAAGEAVAVTDDNVEIKLAHGFQSGADPTGDPDRPALGTTQTVRVCDAYAWELSHRDGAPAFAFYWPEAKRDRAIAAMTTWVRAQVAQ